MFILAALVHVACFSFWTLAALSSSGLFAPIFVRDAFRRRNRRPA